MKYISFAIILIVIIIFAGLSLSFTGKFVKEERIRIGYLPITASHPLFVAVENGYFQEEGLNIELVKFESSNPIMDSLLQRRLDGTGAVSYTTLFSIEEKQAGQFRIINSNGETLEEFASFLIVKNISRIGSAKDLKGKVLLTGPGLAGRSLTEVFLSKFGLTLEDIELVQVSYSMVASTFIEGNVDAVFIWEPFGTIILDKGAGEVLIEGPRPKYVLSPYPASALILSSEFIKNHPEQADKYVKAMDKAIEFIKEFPLEAKKILPKYTPLSEDLAGKTHIYKNWRSDEIRVQNLQKLADLMLEIDLLEKEVDVEGMIY